MFIFATSSYSPLGEVAKPTFRLENGIVGV